MPDGVLGDDERAAEVDAELLVEDVEVEVGERGEVHPARGVDDDVDAAEALRGGGEQRLDGVLVGDVGLDGDRVLRARLLDGRVGLLLVARVVDDDLVAVGGEPSYDRAADPARTTGDDCDTLRSHAVAAWSGEPRSTNSRSLVESHAGRVNA